jgi:hypothetical protein
MNTTSSKSDSPIPAPILMDPAKEDDCTIATLPTQLEFTNIQDGKHQVVDIDSRHPVFTVEYRRHKIQISKAGVENQQDVLLNVYPYGSKWQWNIKRGKATKLGVPVFKPLLSTIKWKDSSQFKVKFKSTSKQEGKVWYVIKDKDEVSVAS